MKIEIIISTVAVDAIKYIYPNYDVLPCTCLTDFCIGNLKKIKSLNEIVDGENNKVFCKYKVLSDSPCNECEYKSECNGGCIGMSYHYFQKLGVGDLRCHVFRSIYEKKDILL